MPAVSETAGDNHLSDAPKRPDQVVSWFRPRRPGFLELHTAEDFLQNLAPDNLGTV
jgi:hypothetical protein